MHAVEPRKAKREPCDGPSCWARSWSRWAPALVFVLWGCGGPDKPIGADCRTMSPGTGRRVFLVPEVIAMGWTDTGDEIARRAEASVADRSSAVPAFAGGSVESAATLFAETRYSRTSDPSWHSRRKGDVVATLIGIAVALAAAWGLLVVFLALARPKGSLVHEALRLLPDTLRLLRRLATDSALPRSARGSGCCSCTSQSPWTSAQTSFP
jgi:hypothetical protein